MALPYYLPQSVPTTSFGTGVPTTTSVQQINQIYQQHNIHTIAFLQGIQQYSSPHVSVGGYNIQPIPFKPFYTSPINSFLKPPQNNLESFSFPHTVPKMIQYPITPMPLRPPLIPYAVSTQSYQFQLRQVVKRVAASDARVNAEYKRLKPSEAVESSSINVLRDKLPSDNSRNVDLIVIPDDNEPSDVKNTKPSSGSRMNPLFIGQTAAALNDLSSNQDPTYWQQVSLKPGPGQQYITKIRALVEGIPGDENHLSPSTKNPVTREKKVRQKSKTKENSSKKKRKISDIEVDSKINPRNWHPDPVPYSHDHLVIGSNGTFISKSFYDTIPWKSYNKSTRILVGHYFNNYTLATQNLDGNNPLNVNVIEDIINHVVVRCNVGRDSVRDIIASICADEARRRQN